MDITDIPKIFIYIMLAVLALVGGALLVANVLRLQQTSQEDLTKAPLFTSKPTFQSSPTISTPSPTGGPKPSPSPTPAPPLVVPSEISWGNRGKQEVILTFDAGGGNQSAASVLQVLKQYHIKATFFITGKWAEDNPDLVKQVASDGNEIYNHTYSHPHLTQIFDSQIITELTQTEQIIFSLTGKTTKPYFRPPFGERDAHVLSVAWSGGYRSVYWTIDALDWKETEGYTASQVKSRVFDNLNPGTIYLFHLGDNITGSILEEVIQTLQNKNYQIVPLTAGL